MAIKTYKERPSMPRSVAVLPEEEQHKLRAVRESGNLPELRQRVLALRLKEWPLRAIGDPLDAPRSTVRMWEKGADPAQPLPEVPECERAERNRGERVIKLRMDVPFEDREELRRLAESARLVRGRTPKESPQRQSADKLDLMIEAYISRNVPVKRIATHMGVTPRAVAARHERYLERKAKVSV
jgi:hypothetical protein